MGQNARYLVIIPAILFALFAKPAKAEAEREAEATAKAEAKASAVAKLAALGLTEGEVAALLA